MTSLEKAIREAGREPMQRDTWYRRIQPTWVDPDAPAKAVTGAQLAVA